MTLLTPAFNDNQQYGLEWLRQMLEAGPVQAGVVGAGDFKVTAAAAGGMRVDVAGGTALIKATTGTRNGLYIAVNDAPIANAVTLANAHATLPRIDLIYLRVGDVADLGSAGDTLTLGVVTGTPTAGVTLDSPGASPGALPADALLLAAVLVPAASAVVSAGNVRDRRPRARGAYFRVQRTSNAGGTNDYTTASTTLTVVDATNLTMRVEATGKPIRATLRGALFNDTASQYAGVAFGVDGLTDAGAALGSNFDFLSYAPAGASGASVQMTQDLVPAAGSHVIAPYFGAVGGGTARLVAQANRRVVFTVEEIVRESSTN